MLSLYSKLPFKFQLGRTKTNWNVTTLLKPCKMDLKTDWHVLKTCVSWGWNTRKCFNVVFSSTYSKVKYMNVCESSQRKESCWNCLPEGLDSKNGELERQGPLPLDLEGAWKNSATPTTQSSRTGSVMSWIVSWHTHTQCLHSDPQGTRMWPIWN